MPQAFRPPIGFSDFRQVRQSGATYVDKTAFVGEVLRSPAQVLLLPRPRRFGKTLNLSTLRYFLERAEEDRAPLFEGLAVCEDAEARQHLARYPVISLSFKDVKSRSFEAAMSAITELLAQLYAEHSTLLEAGVLNRYEQTRYEKLLAGEASPEVMASALKILSRPLAQLHGAPVVVLIDEYDTPLHAGYAHGYYEEATSFFRGFLSAGLKDNTHLFKGVVTGILRVAKESIFSGLNNLSVHTLLDAEFSGAFGFTEDEVAALARLADAEDHVDAIRDWYDGYLFGGRAVYNPWSVLKFLSDPAKLLKPHWAATSANDLVQDLLVRGGTGLTGEIDALLRGEALCKAIEDDVVLRDVERRAEVVWGLLLYSGYLKATDVHVEGATTARLSIPNREVGTIYRNTFRHWMQSGLGSGERVRDMLDALLAGQAERFGHLFGELVLRVLSYHDVGRTPERVFHAFLTGVLVYLEPEFEVRSNRESGLGRFDLMVLPKQAGRPGVVLELKSLEPGADPAKALEAALQQVAENVYATELRARGADPIHEVAAVFDGKRVHVKARG